MQKGSALILVLVGILVIVAVAGGAYFFGKSQIPKPQNSVVTSQAPQITPTPASAPDETANWKTYNDINRQYSINYPQTWFITSGNTSIIYSYDPAKSESELRQISQKLKIDITSSGELTNSQTIEEYAKLKWSDVQDAQVENLLVGGQKSVKVIGTIIDGTKGLQIFIQKGTNVYAISVYGEWQTAYKEVLDQILSTFKFTQN